MFGYGGIGDSELSDGNVQNLIVQYFVMNRIKSNQIFIGRVRLFRRLRLLYTGNLSFRSFMYNSENSIFTSYTSIYRSYFRH